MVNFSLNRTSSRDLNEGDVFIFRVSSHVYQVYLITDMYVHAMDRFTERPIRLNRSKKYAADYVYLALPTSSDRGFNPSSDEASFMIAS